MIQIDKHVFAFYVSCFDLHHNELCIKDVFLMHRMIIVLRMKAGDSCILFNQTCHARVILKKVGKKELIFYVEALYPHIPLQPEVTVYVPILKRSNLEEAISLLGQVGVSMIQLVYTEKSLQKNVDLDRLNMLLIAASEQNKNFVIPLLYKPCSLPEVIKNTANKDLFVCGYGGKPLQELMVGKTHDKKYGVFIGPEQDFSAQEYQLFQQHGITKVSLGSIVFQASLAASLSVFLIRALASEKNDSL